MPEGLAEAPNAKGANCVLTATTLSRKWAAAAASMPQLSSKTGPQCLRRASPAAALSRGCTASSLYTVIVEYHRVRSDQLASCRSARAQLARFFSPDVDRRKSKSISCKVTRNMSPLSATM